MVQELTQKSPDGARVGQTTSDKVAFFGGTPVDQPASLTPGLTAVTASAPGVADYAIQDLVQNTGFGFVSADEGQTILSVIINLQTRVAELEARLEELSLIASN